MGPMVGARDGDIHDMPSSQWGTLGSELVGCVVEIRILCVHPFGVGVYLTAQDAYAHVNVPRVTDGRFTVAEASRHIGEVRRALILSVEPGRQPTLTIRPSEVPNS